MTIVKQISLFDIQELLDLESSSRFDAIFATFDVQPIFHLFSKKTMRGAPRELNYGAMIQSLIIRIVERIPMIKNLVKRLVHDPLFRLDCGLLVSDPVPSEASYSRLIDVISHSNVIDDMQDALIQNAFVEGFLCDEHLAIDATHFESRDAAKPSEKKETPPKKRGWKTKEEHAAWLAEKAEIEANQTTYEKKIEHQLETPLEILWADAPIAPQWGIKKNSDGKNTFWYGFKGHLAVSSKNQYIVSCLMTSGNLHDSKAAIPLLKKMNYEIDSNIEIIKNIMEAIMNRKIKVVQYGIGNIGTYIIQAIESKGAKIVGAIDKDNTLVGRDIGIISNSSLKNIYVNSPNNFKKVLEETRPDICIITTNGFLENNKDNPFFLCASLGINVITSCEEAFYPFFSNPSIYNELDIISKKNNCTILGSGFRDFYCSQLVASLSATQLNVKVIKNNTLYGLNGCNENILRDHGVYQTYEDFSKKMDIYSEWDINYDSIQSDNFRPSLMWGIHGWICKKLNLSIINQIQNRYPVYTSEEWLPNDRMIGVRAVVKTKTKEGIIIESSCTGKFLEKKEEILSEWEVIGDSYSKVTASEYNTVASTAATIINRIPDTINAKPGFLTTIDIGEMQYKHQPLNTYIIQSIS